MSDLRFRPRFQLFLNEDENAIIDRIKKALTENNPEALKGKLKHKHLLIRVNPTKKHFWSPTLDISFEKMEDGQTQMRCLLAPEATVWTMFMFAYTIAAFGAFIGLMIGSSQMQLEHNPWGFWLATACTVLGLLLFFIAQFGKKLAKDEMVSMKEFIVKAVEE
ncbi:MAG: hypothetical protein CMC96_08685 [Flavobacteriales bacterium]|nr:hypothetical protein [Flavobacteriales bacterium]|tara:strand:+ start:1366 stop:1854 length:489 start_codon:yes stop_codon:yes gene_type:complete